MDAILKTFRVFDTTVSMIPAIGATVVVYFLTPDKYRLPVTLSVGLYGYTYTAHPWWCEYTPDIFNNLEMICKGPDVGEKDCQGLMDQIGIRNIPIIGSTPLIKGLNNIPAFGQECTTWAGDIDEPFKLGDEFKAGDIAPQASGSDPYKNVNVTTKDGQVIGMDWEPEH